MVKPKTQSKKQQKRGGIDFKKIKRKVGRTLPPPKNATNTEIKSKAIILPEQSVASEKTGLAVSKKGLTLKELLHQTSHHNAKVRKDALIGIRDIFLKYPAELKQNKLAAIEKLRERISDEDKIVRETLYQLFKSVVFPSCKDDNQAPLISLMMAYIFSAMTHLAVDVRLMAFKFVDLVVQNYPSSFSLNAEKILQNYENVLRKSQFHLQDKSKLRSILAGLLHCLTLLPCNKRDDDSSFENEVPSRVMLHAVHRDADEGSSGCSGITEKLKDLLPILVSCFQDSMPSIHLLDGPSFDCMLYILESINLMAKFFVHEIGKNQQCLLHVPPLSERSTVAVLWDQLMSPAILKKLWDVFPLDSIHCHSEKDRDRYFVLNAIITEIFLQWSEWNYPPPVLVENFLGFIESSLIQQIQNCTQSGKLSHEKHMLPIVCFIPKLVKQITDDWRSRILQAFTEVFKNCSPESSMKFACLSVLEEMLDPERGWDCLVARNPEMLDYQIIWLRELPLLLVCLGDRYPVCSKAVLRLQLLIGKAANLNPSFAEEYNHMQHVFKDFYSTYLDEKGACYGPFIRLAKDIQELSLSCLYYLSSLELSLLQSLVSCCLCQDLEPYLLFRIMEVLHSIYKAGNIQIADYISFFITLLSRFKVYPEEMSPTRHEGMSNRETFRSITSVVCSSLSQIGDKYLVFQMMEKIILDQMLLKLPVDNICAFLRILITLDSKPTRLSEQSIIKISQVLPEYLIHIVSSIADYHEPSTVSISISRYYLLPCFFLFDRSSRLLSLVLNSMISLFTRNGSSLSPHFTPSITNHSESVNAVVSILLLMYEDIKMKRILLSCKRDMESILQTLLTIQSSEEFNMTLEERHKTQTACNCLKAAIP